LEPKGLNPLTVKVMNEVGIDVSQQTSKGVDTYPGKVLFQYLITVCDDADKNCPTVWPGVNTRMHWSFQDPAAFEGAWEEKLKKFREVRDLIETKIYDWLEQGP
jgi:arsenate reductase (thioredoxin)